MPERTHIETRLSGVGKKAFRDLVEVGCDPHVVDGLFTMLTTHSVTLTRKGSRPIEIRMSALDSWDELLFPVIKDELPQIARRARKLLQDIERLRKSHFIRHLNVTGFLPQGDILAGSAVGFGPRRYFHGLLHLPEMAKPFGPKLRPDHTRRLTKLYQHIHERSGQWHDARVADILNDLLQNPGNPVTADSMKAWRSRHGLTD